MAAAPTKKSQVNDVCGAEQFYIMEANLMTHMLKCDTV